MKKVIRDLTKRVLTEHEFYDLLEETKKSYNSTYYWTTPKIAPMTGATYYTKLYCPDDVLPFGIVWFKKTYNAANKNDTYIVEEICKMFR